MTWRNPPRGPGRFPIPAGGTSIPTRLVLGACNGPERDRREFPDTVTQHYFDMNGRMGRERFWYFILAVVVVQIAAIIVQSITFFLPIARWFRWRCCCHRRHGRAPSPGYRP